jgi:uncharacterized protein (TIGR02266 family)
MTADNPQERRRYPRVIVRALVDYESPDTYLYDYSGDLSEGGIFIETENPLPQGTPLTLRFTLPNIESVFEVKAKVAWVNERASDGGESGKRLARGMGVQFESMDDADKATIQGYIRKAFGK